MKRYAGVCALLLAAMLVIFAVVELLDVPLLTDPQPLGARTGMVGAATGVALLVADVVLPVPYSVVMIAHGAVFGIPLGSLLSTVGSLGAFAVAFALGRRSVGLVDRVVTHEERQRADRLLRRWGLVAIILTRPVPMLAETVAFAAGGSSIRWPVALGAAAIASFPMAAVYAVAGAVAADFATGVVVFLAVAAVAVAAGLAVKPRRVPVEDR